ncbi:MATE family efflux transporter [Alkaliphilus serpentinus]|uniref:Multidrug export protein MepA n=1 Tax=Alkaliphilus serpentinus TaxID=1482731 RepID=A0A833M641_9FIRM|nr:MATE family efflux transporter [Alkaliphilus serpentinus]KAB3526247.1 MATE family efflux transporter [Alkaliphilus serpentinus]
MLSQSEKLGKEKVSTLLLKMSLPAIIGMMVNSLYNVVDTIFIGRGVGPMAIGGLAIAFPIQMLTMGFAQLVGIGSASAVSRNLGANNTERADHVAGNAYVLIIGISLIFATIGLLFTDTFLKVFGATPGLMPFARDYIRVIFLGSVFFSFTMATQYLIQAEGNAKIAMTSTLIGALLNIALDPLFIFGLKAGIKGAAYATIISQFASFVFIISYLYSGKSSLKVRLHHLKPRLEIIREIFAVGASAFTRSTTNTIFSIVINNSLRIYGGDIAITIFGIVNRIIAFLFLPIMGVVQGMQPIAGYNYGAKKIDRVKEVVKLSIIASTVIAILGWIMGQSFPQVIIMAFTDDDSIITKGAFVFRMVIAMIPFLGLQFVGATLFQALGKAVPALVLSLLRQFTLLTPLILLLPRLFNLGLMGVWVSFPVADILAVIITGFLLKHEMRKINKEMAL